MQNTPLPSHFFSGSRSPAGVNWLPRAAVTSLCQLTPAEGLAVGSYFPEGTVTLPKCALSPAVFPLPSLMAAKLDASSWLGKRVSVFKSTTVKGKGRLPHISSLSRSRTEAPRCPMEGEGLLDTSHSPSGMFPPAQWSGTVPSLSGQSQHTIFYATIFVVGSNGLVSGTSAGSKTPFVGVYTTPLASCCRLLKPQPGTAFQVWLRAEKKKTNQLASNWYQSCSALPC